MAWGVCQTPECQVVFDDYVKKLKEVLSSFEQEASTVSFNGQSLVLEREEAEKVKAMPEFSELAESCEKYKTDRPDGALNHIADLVQKMPQKIREAYWEQLSAFEAEQKATSGRAKIRISMTFVLYYVAAAADLVVFARYWYGWAWLGFKGAAAAFMFIVPMIGVVHTPGGTSTDENPNPSSDFAMSLILLYWGAAFMTLTTPSWDSYSGFTQILLAIIGLIIVIIIVASFGVTKDNKKKAVEKAAISVGYLSDFEKISSQSEEYRAFKADHTK